MDAVRCAIEVQNGMVERNAGVAPERRIEFRVGIHLGDVVEVWFNRAIAPDNVAQSVGALALQSLCLHLMYP